MSGDLLTVEKMEKVREGCTPTGYYHGNVEVRKALRESKGDVDKAIELIKTSDRGWYE